MSEATSGIFIVPACRIAQRHVDFAFLERDRITTIFHADDELFSCVFVMALKQVLDFEFLASDPGGFIPVYLSDVS